MKERAVTADRRSPRSTIEVLLVDPTGTDARDGLAAGDEAFEVAVVPTAAAALDHLEREPFDCVVSRYALPDDDGLTLLARVRDGDDVPFVLFPRDGSEAVASEAIAAGVSDYVPDDGGTDRYERLAARVERAVCACADPDTLFANDSLRALAAAYPDMAFLLDESGRYLDVMAGPESEADLYAPPEEFLDRRVRDVLPEGPADRLRSLIERTLETGSVQSLTYGLDPGQGQQYFEARTAPLPRRRGRGVVVCTVRDVTDRLQYEQTLTALHRSAQTLAHDETREAVAGHAAETATQVLDFSGVAVFIHDPENAALRPVVHAGKYGEEYDSLPTLPADRDSNVGAAFLEGETIVQNDLQTAQTGVPVEAFDDERLREAQVDFRSGLYVSLGGHGVLVAIDETVGEFDDVAVELAELLGATVTDALDRVDREAELRDRERELEIYETIVDATSDPIYAIDDDGQFILVNDAYAAATGREKADLLGEHISALVDDGFADEEAYERGREASHELVDGEREERRFEAAVVVDGEERIVENNLAVLAADDGPYGTVNVLRDVTERAERERVMAAQRDELDTLNQINSLVHEVIGSLVRAATREEIEATVCERLADSALYQAAWTGERDVTGEGLVPRTAAGFSDDYVEWLGAQEGAVARDGPANAAVQTGEPQVIEAFEGNDAIPEEARAEADRIGMHSGICVPLAYGSAVYGILAVGSPREDAFSDREQSAFQVLGEVIGFAINAVQNRRLLLSDTTTELEFVSTDDGSFFNRTSAAAGCRLSLEGLVPVGDGTLVYYVGLDGTRPEQIQSLADEAAHIDDVRVVTERADDTLLEVTVSGESVVLALVERGASIQTAVSDNGESHLTVNVAPNVDVRTLVENVRESFPALRMVTRKELEFPQRAGSGFREVLDERLTERQRASLQAAYYGGYFEWPRESTAEEVADAMGISSPTLHQHLRAAQRKLLCAFFDDPSGT